MELEEMKTLWEEMSIKLEKQKKMTDTLIIKMTKENYRNKISKILIPEMIGSLGCAAQIVFTLINFQDLNTWYLSVCGIIALVVLLLMPLLSLQSVRALRSVNISQNDYKQSLLHYSKSKKQFVLVQKINFYLGCILMIVILPVMGQLVGGKDLFKVTQLWWIYAIGFIFFYAFARWVYKCYVTTASDAEDILKELED
jgi:cobalamin synthase